MRSLVVMYTHTSPSVEAWRGSFSADHTDYLPLDDRKTLDVVFNALHPACICLSRADLWPGLVSTAHRSGTRVGIIGGAISSSSRRLRQPWKFLLRNHYGLFDFVLCDSEADAVRFEELGVSPTIMTVAGNLGIDAVRERSVLGSLLHRLGGLERPIFCIGSSEPSDEPVLTKFVREYWRKGTLFWVPHRNDPETIARIERSLDGVPVYRFPSLPSTPAQSAVLVTGQGTLFSLYAASDFAFVGGGFKRGKLHSVLEPAVFATPSAFGPYWSGHPVAEQLVEVGGALAVDGDEAARDLGCFLDMTVEERWERGIRGREILTAEAADRSAEVVHDYAFKAQW